MKKNVGVVDRIIRVIVGVAILMIGWYYQSWWGLIGIVPLLTAAIGFCPAYSPMCISTCASKTEESKPEPTKS
jgi:hypothetical protein